jgi:hypothetical protein
MAKYNVVYIDPIGDELSITVTAYGSNEAVYIAEKAVDMCEIVSIDEVTE